MKSFITAIPLFDIHMAVKAYYLCEHNSERPLGLSFDFQMLGESLVSRGLDFIEDVGLNAFTNGLPLFVSLNEYQLLMDILSTKRIPPDKLVCVLPKDLKQDEVLSQTCRRLLGEGYHFAIGVLPTEDPYSTKNVSIAEYILLDYKHPLFRKHLKEARPFYNRRIFVITNVPDRETLKALSTIPNALFSGRFYDQPLSEGNADVSPLKINALQLLKQVSEEDTDLVALAEIIERDPFISVSLLRFINSTWVGLGRRVESIRAAVAILGQLEMKRWVTIAVSIAISSDRPSEITKLALLRAKFAENLARNSGKSFLAPSLFTAGLFSLLDVMLNVPMELAVKEIAVSPQITKALVEKEGNLYEFLELVYAYERADWDDVSLIMIQKGYKAEHIVQAFSSAMQWYRDLLVDIDSLDIDSLMETPVPASSSAIAPSAITHSAVSNSAIPPSL